MTAIAQFWMMACTVMLVSVVDGDIVHVTPFWGDRARCLIQIQKGLIQGQSISLQPHPRSRNSSFKLDKAMG